LQSKTSLIYSIKDYYIQVKNKNANYHASLLHYLQTLETSNHQNDSLVESSSMASFQEVFRNLSTFFKSNIKIFYIYDLHIVKKSIKHILILCIKFYIICEIIDYLPKALIFETATIIAMMLNEII
jgi:hypothetical protein